MVRNIAMNDGGNTLATAYIYKKDAPKRQVLNEDAVVPADSEAGRALLAEGGEAAKKYVSQVLHLLKSQQAQSVVSLKPLAASQVVLV